MILPNEKKFLRELIAQVERLANEAPDEAVAFKLACNRLAGSTEEIDRRGHFGSFEAHERKTLEFKRDRLVEVATGIPLCTEKREKARATVFSLQGRSGDSPEVDTWLQSWCQNWQQSLTIILADVDSPEGLDGASTRLDQVLKFSSQTTEALTQLRRAQDQIKILERENMGAIPVEIAPQVTQLESLPHLLIQRGATAPFFDKLRAIQLTLQTYIDRPQANPKDDPAYEACRKEIDESQGWAEVLTADAVQAVDELRRRLRDAEMDYRAGGASEFRAIHHEARSLAAQLRDQASEQRAQLLHDLQRDLQVYKHACGSDSLAESAVQEAEEIHDLTPYQHSRVWLVKAGRARALLLEAVNGAQAAGYIDTHYQKEGKALRSKLSTIHQHITDEATRTEVRVLEQMIETIQQSHVEVQALDSLNQLHDAHPRVAKMEARCDKLRKELEQEQGQLQSELRRIHHLSTRLGESIEVDSIEKRIRAPLSEARREAETIRNQFMELAATLIQLAATSQQTARELFGRHQSRHQKHRSLLLLLGQGDDPPELPGLAAESSLEELVGAVESANEQAQAAEAWVQSLFDELISRARENQTRLETIPNSDLTLNDRGYRDNLVFQLAQDEAAPELRQVSRLEKRLALLEACDKFLEVLSAKDTRAKARYQELRRRLNGLREHGLREHCGPLELRVTALIHGIPEDSTRWSRFSDQLKLASRLLEQVESEARRRCAAQLRADLKCLNEKADRSTNSEFKQQARTLFDRLYGPESQMNLPSPMDRQQVRYLLDY